MTVLIHISDLHFGPKFDEHLSEVILSEINAAKPDLVVVSGDWTMRGRVSEYERARDYLQKLPPPVLTIPGNHDQPLHWMGSVERFTRPWARYRTYIHQDTDVVFRAAGLFVIGLLDSHNLLPGGIWSAAQRRWMQKELSSAPSDACKVLVMHHHLLWQGKWSPAGQWFPQRTLNRLAKFGVELILNGHTHIPVAAQSAQGIVIAQAGTSMSTRTRQGHGNTYNRIEISETTIDVAIHEYDSAANHFVPKTHAAFPRRKEVAQ